MNVSSADLFGAIGFNEIDSFNKTLNEMLQVWNLPIDQQQQQQQQQQNQQVQQDMSNILNITSKGLPRFNFLNTSSSGLKDINLSASTNSLMIPDMFNSGNGDEQQSGPKLNASGKGFDFIKTINEISNEQKQFQPFEIIPVKNINNNNNNSSNSNNSSNNNNNNNNNSNNNNNNNNNSSNSNNNSNNNNSSGVTEFGVINATSFNLDPSKIEELRLNPSVLDPFLTLPYNTNNSSIQKKSINNLTNNGIIGGNTTSGPIRNTFTSGDKGSEANIGSPSTFSLNKEELNTITSTEMNAYVKQASIVKELTPVEKKELKRQKRLIKNRESAHLSRQRKRERLTDLEHRVEELTSNSADINKTLSSLENENLILKAEVSQLFEVINDSPVLSALFYTIYSQTHQQQKESIETY